LEKTNPNQPLSQPMAASGRNHRLLPALAKNKPLACFLNASRPLAGEPLWCAFPQTNRKNPAKTPKNYEKHTKKSQLSKSVLFDSWLLCSDYNINIENSKG
jgi:hypothetical protein